MGESVLPIQLAIAVWFIARSCCPKQLHTCTPSLPISFSPTHNASLGNRLVLFGGFTDMGPTDVYYSDVDVIDPEIGLLRPSSVAPSAAVPSTSAEPAAPTPGPTADAAEAGAAAAAAAAADATP